VPPRGAADGHLGETNSGTDYFYQRNHRGDVVGVTNSSGNLFWSSNFDPYGRPIAFVGTFTPDFGFTGMYLHPRSGLNLAVYRAYGSGLGRWINRDPIGEHGGVNLYAYVLNSPANSIDPSGTDALGGFLGGLAGGIAGGLGGLAIGGLEGAPLGPRGSIAGGINLGQAGAAGGAAIGWNWGSQFPVAQGIKNSLGGFGSGSSISLPTFCQAKSSGQDPPADAWKPNGAKAPGYPGMDPGTGSVWKPNKKGPTWNGKGWVDGNGNVWKPTGPGSTGNTGDAHSGPHWDIDDPKGKKIGNMYPGGTFRP
jgi:RHS repeat-associated protein